MYAYNRHSWLNGNIAIVGKICQEALADTAGNPACNPESRREECNVKLLFHVCPSTACEYAIEQIHIERDDYGSDQNIRILVAALFTRAPMRSFLPVNITRGMSAKGREKLSTTWLITRLRVGSRLKQSFLLDIATWNHAVLCERRIEDDCIRSSWGMIA